MADIQSTIAIRQQLVKTWFPFFSRFGRLTDVQVQAIPHVLSGANVVIESPTASGKTEAVVAPVIERLNVTSADSVRILYVVPTRALANDIVERLVLPSAELGVRVALRHGDKPHISTQAPHLLVTTPESLDSLICRRINLLKSISVVVVDEIHLLDGTYRGDQVRVLLNRLSGLLSDGQPSVHLMSATMGNVSALSKRYVDRSEIVTVAGQREIKLAIVGSLDDVVSLAKARSWKKLLCFCNSRKRVETCAADMVRLWRPYSVVAHHGSLSRAQREAAEQVMKESAPAICVATSTLEIGIDIGSIDAVCLLDVPLSVVAFLQRLGRGNRRSTMINGVALVSDEAEQNQISGMHEAAQTGVLSIPDYFSDTSVVVQQIYSILFQYPGGYSRSALFRLVSCLCTEEDFEAIVANLLTLCHVEAAGDRLFASTRIMDQAEMGLIHSNIPDSAERSVINIATGTAIGSIAGVPTSVFLLAGRAWKYVKSNSLSIWVQRYSGKADPARYLPRSTVGRYFGDLPAPLQARLIEQMRS